jgi:hypothetical protein
MHRRSFFSRTCAAVLGLLIGKWPAREPRQRGWIRRVEGRMIVDTPLPADIDLLGDCPCCAQPGVVTITVIDWPADAPSPHNRTR